MSNKSVLNFVFHKLVSAHVVVEYRSHFVRGKGQAPFDDEAGKDCLKLLIAEAPQITLVAHDFKGQYHAVVVGLRCAVYFEVIAQVVVIAKFGL